MDYLADFIAKYRNRTARSRTLSEQNRALAEPLQPVGFHSSMKEICYPIAATAFASGRFRDVDENDYVDFCMGLGSNLFGHNPAFVKAALIEQIERGYSVGPQAELASQLASLLVELTGMERVAFGCTGTEAVMVAVRLARTVTLRDRIALFSGSYHGQNDETLVRSGFEDDPFHGIPLTPGVPRHIARDALVLPYASAESLEIISMHRDELAAVLVEGGQPHRPEREHRTFFHRLRELTHETDIAFICDEMMTGFRLAPGGAQEYYGVRADIATYGKVIGGGMPLSVVAGKARFLNAIDGGPWSFGDASGPSALTTYVASTFSKHPLSLAAARATAIQLRDAGAGLQKGLNEQTRILVDRLNCCLAELETSLRFTACGSFFAPQPPFDESSTLIRLLHYHLASSGVFLWGVSGFLSTAHTPQDLDCLCDALRLSMLSLRDAGFAVDRSDPGLERS